MPELVSNGPRIPASLLNEADSGGMVLFCGAGVSAGRESGLPSFVKLVKLVKLVFDSKEIKSIVNQ